MGTVSVRIDDRVRLLSALLAATSWPEDEQRRKPHGTHAHARSTRRLVLVHNKHPAVLIMQALLDRGVMLDAVYTFMMQLSWPGLSGGNPPTWVPPTWNRHLLSFYEQTGLAQWWQEEAQVWARSREEVERALGGADLGAFLRRFVGDFDDDLVFIPNICYPTDVEIGVRANSELCCIVPPRIAWGDNPPWPFDEDPAHIFRATLTRFGRLLMQDYLHQHQDVLETVSRKKLPVSKSFVEAHPGWEEQFLTLFTAGLVAIYLEDFVSKAEADAFVLLEKKTQGIEVLPGVVSVLRRYLSGHESGQYPAFIDYLPHFGKHLRVARTITSL